MLAANIALAIKNDDVEQMGALLADVPDGVRTMVPDHVSYEENTMISRIETRVNR